MKRNILTISQWVVGAGDVVTGLLLVFVPVSTLKLMMIDHVYQDTGLLAFVGVFVLGVGLSYFLVPKDIGRQEHLAQWKMQWKISALVRILVAVFMAVQIFINDWHIAWVSVLLTDLGYGGLQLFGLKQKWLEKISEGEYK